MTAPKRRPAAKPKAKGKVAAEPPAPPRPFRPNALVPPHELLSVAETEATLKQLGTTIDRLPKIMVSDPGMKTDPKYVAARDAREALAGRLVRIRRPSQTAGEALAYRVLISGTSGD
ncbi:MAG TPA: DNA-directed RNA polymerase subunit H [Thermoplasmata archaeon]|nr:DNA-directed RNA polymerase subunit H [Thermoplasmata archaeon]